MLSVVSRLLRRLNFPSGINKVSICILFYLRNGPAWVVLPHRSCRSYPVLSSRVSSSCVRHPRDSEGRKLCKKVKVDPSSRPRGAELLHYKLVAANLFFPYYSFILSSSSPRLTLAHLMPLHCQNPVLQCFWESLLSAVCLVCFSETGHFTQSTTGQQPLRYPVFSFFFFLLFFLVLIRWRLGKNCMYNIYLC